MSIALALEVVVIVIMGLPVFAHYLRELAYDLFCVVWNTIAFIVNTMVFLFGRK